MFNLFQTLREIILSLGNTNYVAVIISAVTIAVTSFNNEILKVYFPYYFLYILLIRWRIVFRGLCYRYTKNIKLSCCVGIENVNGIIGVVIKDYPTYEVCKMLWYLFLELLIPNF